MLGYVVAVLVLLQQALRAWVAHRAGVSLPPLVAGTESMLPGFLLLNLALLGWRLAMRAGFTGAAYGWAEGLMAMPRAVLANAINFLAALKAVARYRQALGTGAPPDWGKTAHRFPDAGLETANG